MNKKKLLYLYFFIIILFAGIYNVIFKLMPDSFVVNKQLNILPFTKDYSFLWNDNDMLNYKIDIDNNYSNISLIDIQLKLNKQFSLISKYRSEVEQQELSLRNIILKRKQLVRQQETLIEKNIEQYKHDMINKSYIFEKNKLTNEIKSLIDLNNTDMNSIIENKKIRLNVIEYKIAFNKYKILQYISKNYSSFSDNNLSIQIKNLNKQETKIRDKIYKFENQIGDIRGKINRNLIAWKNSLSMKLDIIDFIYYSIGISTTTTFGDIIANSKIVRLFVSIQLLISIIIVTSLVNQIIQKDIGDL